jgi:hypothetical protein
MFESLPLSHLQVSIIKSERIQARVWTSVFEFHLSRGEHPSSETFIQSESCQKGIAEATFLEFVLPPRTSPQSFKSILESRFLIHL